MVKRGQVTAIVAVGIVILLAFMFVYFLREGYIDRIIHTGSVSKRLELEMSSIKQEQVNPCIQKTTKKAVEMIGENGGYLSSIDYAYFFGKKYTILCKPVTGNKNTCAREVLDVKTLEKRMNDYLDKELVTCIDLSSYRGKDYSLKTGDLKTDVHIGDKAVVVDVDYPIALKKGSVNFDVRSFNYVLDFPLGEFMSITNDILNSEAETGDFDSTWYSLSQLRYRITKYTLAPRRFYIINNLDSDYRFKFAVQV